MVTVTVNGERYDLPQPMTLSALLERLEVDARRVAVGYNGEVADRERYGEIVVRDGDRIDIVHMVGGG